eukprot:5978243-Pyramimonas_sp.AAC.1
MRPFGKKKFKALLKELRIAKEARRLMGRRLTAIKNTFRNVLQLVQSRMDQDDQQQVYHAQLLRDMFHAPEPPSESEPE